jgi:hypothetical protein
MINPTRTKNVRQTILEALKFAQGYALLEDTLKTHVDGLLRPPVGAVEWSAAIKWLSDGKHIVAVENDMDDELVQWAITERGRVLLSTL